MSSEEKELGIVQPISCKIEIKLLYKRRMVK